MAAPTLKKTAKKAATKSEDLVQLINAACVVVSAASALLKEAKPILDELDTDAIIERAAAGAKSIKKGTSAAGAAIKNMAGGAANAMSSVISRLGESKESALSSVAGAKSEKDLRKAIQKARQSVLENATTTVNASDLIKTANKPKDGTFGPINDLPGCFVIATYGKLDFGNDLTDYKNIYVGKALNTLAGVLETISRDGNPDVYADIKYKQNVRIFVFNCSEEELDERYFSLYQTFAERTEENNG